MLSAIIRWSLARPWLGATLAVLLFLYGLVELGRAKFDVFPDFVPSQAEVQTEAPGLSAEQVEQLVTRPIEQAVNGAAGVDAVRSESIQGLSIVTVIFGEGADPYRARQIVSESIGEAGGALPSGVSAPKVSPLTSSTMDLLKVGFLSDRLDPAALRDFVQWKIRPRLMAVPGVARATLYGGIVRHIEVQVRPDELAMHGAAVDDVAEAVRQAAGAAGGGYIDTPEQRLPIEARGQARDAADIAAAMLPASAASQNAAPVRVGDVAKVSDGAAPNTGDALIMGKPGVLISMSSQYGANTLDVTRAVEAALEEFKPALKAQGITMVSGLHRPANFIDAALHGIIEDLLIGAALIAAVLFLFMRKWAPVLISFISIPLSLLAAIIVLDRLGLSINTMSLGGLAVALGVVVDDAIIDVENIIRRLRAAPPDASRAGIILDAAVEVRAPVVYATFIVALVLAPVLMLGGLQGAFFAPLAASFILATLISLVVALTITPALALLLLNRAQLDDEPPRLRSFKARIIGELPLLIGHGRTVMFGSLAALVLAAIAWATFTPELLPDFKEGHFVLGVSAPPGTSLAEMRDYGERITHDLLAIPTIQTVEQQIGRAEGGEDSWGTERSEFHVELKPGLSGSAQDETQDKIHEVLNGYPGLTTEVLTFLGDRIGESLSGETASLAIGIYGADPDTLGTVADRIAAVVAKVPGAVDARRATPPESPIVRVDVDPIRASAMGVTPAQVLNAVRAAYAGAPVAQLYKEDRTIDVAVTLPPELRETPEAVGGLLVRTVAGTVVPLDQVAHVYLAQGRSSIAHEGGRTREVVTTNPAPEDTAEVTAAVRDAIAREVKLPQGVYLDYVGTAEAALSARNELLRNTGFALAGVIVLLMMAFGDARAVMLILGSTVLAMTGGVAAVLVSGGNLSLGSLVGFVTLFGIAARNAILLVAHVEQVVEDEGQPWSIETLLAATRDRMTPILMTALVTAMGVLPLALANGEAGREIQAPMAVVILGGLVTSTFTSIYLLPVLMSRWWNPRGRQAPQS